MRVKVSDPRHLDDLAEFLAARLDAIHERVSLNELEVSPLGSLSEKAAASALDDELRSWEACHPGIRAQRQWH
jgi:hypothetical protein